MFTLSNIRHECRSDQLTNCNRGVGGKDQKKERERKDGNFDPKRFKQVKQNKVSILFFFFFTQI